MVVELALCLHIGGRTLQYSANINVVGDSYIFYVCKQLTHKLQKTGSHKKRAGTECKKHWSTQQGNYASMMTPLKQSFSSRFVLSTQGQKEMIAYNLCVSRNTSVAPSCWAELSNDINLTYFQGCLASSALEGCCFFK